MLIIRHPPRADRISIRTRSAHPDPAWFEALTDRLRKTESPLAFVALFAIWSPVFVVLSMASIARGITASGPRRPRGRARPAPERRIDLLAAHSRRHT